MALTIDLDRIRAIDSRLDSLALIHPELTRSGGSTAEEWMEVLSMVEAKEAAKHVQQSVRLAAELVAKIDAFAVRYSEETKLPVSRNAAISALLTKALEAEGFK